MDKEAKTPLILASMNPQLYDVPETLIEFGANLNAYHLGELILLKNGCHNVMSIVLQYA